MMTNTSIQADTLVFLNELKNNNNRDWFAQNKERYIAANNNFILFVEDLIKQIAKFDSSVSLLEAKKTVFRIYKDVRFSKDKLPYKTNFGAAISAKGRGSGMAGYYLHIEPGKSFLGGGAYMVPPQILKNIRQEISYNSADFLKIIENKTFKNLFSLSGEKLSRVPQGFDKEDKMAEYLKFKNFIVTHSFEDNTILSKSFVNYCATAFEAMAPFNHFLNIPILDSSEES